MNTIDPELQKIVDRANEPIKNSRLEVWALNDETSLQRKMLNGLIFVARVKIKLSRIRTAYLEWRIKRLQANNARRTSQTG